MQEINIIIGRFQPLTTGHIRCAVEARKKTGCPTVLCMIETPKEKADARHPFPSEVILPWYRAILKKNADIIDIVLVKNADIIKNAEILAEKGYIIRSWSCGTDRIDSYTKMSARYAEQANLPSNFEMIEIKRGDDDESATKLREALRNDDFDTFVRMSPIASYPRKRIYYEELRWQILKIKD